MPAFGILLGRARGVYNPRHQSVIEGKIVMARFHRFGVLLAALLLSANVYAGDVQVEGAWARATVPGQDRAMVYMSITSTQNATIVGVSSKASKTTEMHAVEHKGGTMNMFQVKSISLPANERMDMSMHGYHLELAGLKAPLKAGETVPLTMNIEMADKRIVKIDVRAEIKPLINTPSQK